MKDVELAILDFIDVSGTARGVTRPKPGEPVGPRTEMLEDGRCQLAVNCPPTRGINSGRLQIADVATFPNQIRPSRGLFRSEDLRTALQQRAKASESGLLGRDRIRPVDSEPKAEVARATFRSRLYRELRLIAVATSDGWLYASVHATERVGVHEHGTADRCSVRDLESRAGRLRQ
jgi:hypothetical protein